MEVPKLIRTLSTQHWVATDFELVNKNLNECIASEVDNWKVRVLKFGENYALHQTFYKGNLLHVDLVELKFN